MPRRHTALASSERKEESVFPESFIIAVPSFAPASVSVTGIFPDGQPGAFHGLCRPRERGRAPPHLPLAGASMDVTPLPVRPGTRSSSYRQETPAFRPGRNAVCPSRHTIVFSTRFWSGLYNPRLGHFVSPVSRCQNYAEIRGFSGYPRYRSVHT